MGRQDMCINHPERAAETRCRQCRKPICSECIKSDANGQFCSFQCAQKFADFQAREKPKDLKQGSFLKQLIGLAVLVAVAVYVGAKFFHIGICVKILKKVGLG